MTVVNNGALARVYLRQCPAGGSRGHNIAVVENARNREKVVHVTLDHNIGVIEVNVPHDHVASVRTRAEAAAAAHPPHFDPFARGFPTDWNRLEDNTLIWSEGTRQYFEALSAARGVAPRVDICAVLRFLHLRTGPDGLPVALRLGPPVPQEDGWTKLRWLDLTDEERTRLETEGWERAWHGSKVEAMYSMLYHGRLLEGDRFLTDAPGLNVHKEKTSHKAENHIRWVPLCGDGVFWAVKWEVLVDPNQRVKPHRKTDQWVRRGCSERLVALWLCGRTSDGMCEGAEVAKRWVPELEANPMQARWITRAKAEQQANATRVPVRSFWC